jgi:LCP family protein required for cell wall assembly
MSGVAGVPATRERASLDARPDAESPHPDGRSAPPPDGRDPRPPRTGRSRRGRRIAAVIGAALTVVVVASVVFGSVAWRRIDRVHVDFPGSPPGGKTFLLIGSDARSFVKSDRDRSLFGTPPATEGERADIILLVRTLPSGGTRVLGIPRDLVTVLPNGVPIRMTQTLLRGPQTVVDTLCQSLGIGVDHLAIIHFDGLRRVVDAAGGITVNAPAPERDLITRLDIPHAGVNHLDGQQALAYVRSRHMEWLSPYAWIPFPPTASARSDRAREVLSQLGGRLALSPASPFSSAEKLWALTGALSVDGKAGPFVLRDLARRLGAIGASSNDTELPVTFRSGVIPTATLQAGAGAALTRFQGGTTPRCSLRTAQITDIPPGTAASHSPGGTP